MQSHPIQNLYQYAYFFEIPRCFIIVKVFTKQPPHTMKDYGSPFLFFCSTSNLALADMIRARIIIPQHL